MCDAQLHALQGLSPKWNFSLPPPLDTNPVPLVYRTCPPLIRLLDGNVLAGDLLLEELPLEELKHLVDDSTQPLASA